MVTPSTLLAYSVRDASTLVSVSEKTMIREVAAGRIETRRARRRVLITHAALEAWLASLPTTTTETIAPKGI